MWLGSKSPSGKHYRCWLLKFIIGPLSSITLEDAEPETRALCPARLYAMMGRKRLSAILEACAMYPHLRLDQPAPLDGHLPVENARLYYRAIGQGQPIILLHGGPDFDHTYFLPDMDRLSDSFRLIYYDQRGRGKSAAHVQPEDVSLASEMQDVESVRD